MHLVITAHYVQEGLQSRNIDSIYKGSFYYELSNDCLRCRSASVVVHLSSFCCSSIPIGNLYILLYICRRRSTSAELEGNE